MVLIIGFHGLAGSGKDTSAECLEKIYHDKKILKLAFAKPLKDACKILFNLTDDQLYHPKIKEQMDERWKKSPRELLQWMGTDVLRNNITEEFFLVHLNQRIEEGIKNGYEIFLITDCRFDNEAELIKEKGGSIFHIVRPNLETTIHNQHATEKGISKHLIDNTIINDSSIESLGNKLKNLLRD